MSDRCETCKWWRKSGADTYAMEGRGRCHGAAPASVTDRSEGYTPAGYRIWPITDQADFCAAHISDKAISDARSNTKGEM